MNVLCNIVRTFSIAILIYALLVSNSDSYASDNLREQTNILILDSYNPFMPWSHDFYEGLNEISKKSDYNIHLFMEYLDAQGMESEVNYEFLFRYLKEKYKNIHFSGVIANSDVAAEFTLNYGQLLAVHAPKVIYTTKRKSLNDDDTVLHLWGDVNLSVDKTVEIALQQNPGVRSALIIEGDNDSSRHRCERVRQQLKTYKSITVKTVSDFSLAELKRIVAGLDRDTIIFCSLIWSDKTGSHLVPREVAEEIATISNAPVYSFWGSFMGTGIVGGHLLDAGSIGKQMVYSLLDYMESGHFSKSNTTLRTFIDLKAVRRFSLDMESIPEKAVLINHPVSLWQRFRREFIVAGISLLIFSVSAVIWLSKLSVLNSMLRKSRDELEKRVDERTSELTLANVALKDSEARYHAFSNAIFEGVSIIKKGKIIDGNNILSEMLGYPLEEIIGSEVTRFVAPDEVERVKSNILTGHNSLYESLSVKKDGTVFPVEIRGRIFRYKGEMVRVTAIRDISERKQAEKALQETNKKLMDMAMQDGLTGIANRRNFDIKLEEEWRRMMRDRKMLSLIIFDVDYFKLYNDTYGHQAGDICLQTIAGHTKSIFKRSGDMLARYGGEEFVGILPGTDGHGAAVLAEQIRVRVENLKMPHESSEIGDYVTVSCGCSSVVPNKSTTLQALLEVADKALYEAKETGRNRVVSRKLN
ncbi:sensor domain-containing diguanylate cyclase [Maridesulfovibrio bastinii]|uniref:sensor domain-containing diguanylate cyclase n=1 Tax=Maridesulfovibrio bastinii TaxID=47157 RepID=UPI00042180B2|nr:sensor domain-containing diguanylate cyclase [Maridesulfovibrio bastinii]